MVKGKREKKKRKEGGEVERREVVKRGRECEEGEGDVKC